MVDIQSEAAEIRRGKKKMKETNQGAKYNGLPYYIGPPVVVDLLSITGRRLVDNDVM